MNRVLTAGWAELLEFDAVWVVTTVLTRDVVTSLAVGTCHGDLGTDI